MDLQSIAVAPLAVCSADELQVNYSFMSTYTGEGIAPRVRR
jgi:hypothetical protein